VTTINAICIEKSNKSQKPSPQKLTISIGELLVKINPMINTIKVKIIANKNASGKYFCTILSKKYVTAFNMIFPPLFSLFYLYKIYVKMTLNMNAPLFSFVFVIGCYFVIIIVYPLLKTT